MSNNSWNSKIPVGIDKGGSNTTTFTNTDGVVVFDGSALTNYAGPIVDSSGFFLSTTQPVVIAYQSADSVANVTGDGTVYTYVGDSIFLNQSSSYSGITGIFTAPVKGAYFVTGMIALGALTASFPTAYLTFVHSNGLTWRSQLNPGVIRDGNNTMTMNQSQLLQFDEDDTLTMTITVFGGTQTVNSLGETFGIHLSSFNVWLVL